MNTGEFLDAVKARHALPSDYALAKRLGWTPQRISGYRTKYRELDDDGCIQIAAELELPPAYVMACIAAERAKDAEIKRHWLAAAKLLKTGTAAVILATVMALSQNAPRAESVQQNRLTERAIHYAQSRRRRRRAAQRALRLCVSHSAIVRTSNKLRLCSQED